MARKIKHGSVIIALVAVLAAFFAGTAGAAARPVSDSAVPAGAWFDPCASWGEGF